MANIMHHIFNNSNYSVYYGVDNDKKGIKVEDRPTSVEVTGNKKLYIWAAENIEALPQDCCIKFPTRLLEGGESYEAGDFELNLTQKGKKFILSGVPDSPKDIKVLVSVRDKKEEVE